MVLFEEVFRTDAIDAGTSGTFIRGFCQSSGSVEARVLRQPTRNSDLLWLMPWNVGQSFGHGCLVSNYL